MIGSNIVFVIFLQILISRSYGIGNTQLNELDGSFIYDFIGSDVFFEIIDPPELQYTYRLRPARNFGAPFNESFLQKKIGLVPYEPSTGCTPPVNGAQLKGSVALIERGTCTFYVKSIMAEEAGAKAVIITDYHSADEETSRTSPLWADHYYIDMVLDEEEPVRSVDIPAGFLLGKNGHVIRETLKKLNMDLALINIPVNLTFSPIHSLHQPPWHSW